MDHNVIHAVKFNYRKNLLFHVVVQSGNTQVALKNVNLKSVVVFNLTEAWDLTQPKLIRSSWKKLWPQIHSIVEGGEANKTGDLESIV